MPNHAHAHIPNGYLFHSGNIVHSSVYDDRSSHTGVSTLFHLRARQILYARSGWCASVQPLRVVHNGKRLRHYIPLQSN